MDTWILQEGFPRWTCPPRTVGCAVSPTPLPRHSRRDRPDLWKIPLQMRGSSAGARSRKVLLEDASDHVDIDGPVDWAVVNAGGHGFYRVSYSESSPRRCEPTSTAGRQRTLRAHLGHVGDGRVRVRLALPPSSNSPAAYRHETEYAIWQAMIGGLASIKHHVVADDDLAAFQALVATSSVRRCRRLGWEPTSRTSRT
jgi:puromycin-sensitive aminopeptidase